MTEKIHPTANPITRDIAYLFHIFDNQIRLVGGCVRDFLRQKQINDYDFATPLPPTRVLEILEQHHIPVYKTGLKHGTVTAVYHHIPYEITTLRSDFNTDGRHAEVNFISDYPLDAKRRDFTMNALYMDETGQIEDYVDGIKDIQEQRVRFIGNAEQRVSEDYLRILRYFRFMADIGINQIDTGSLNACQKHRIGLRQISIERIREEMLKLLMKPFVIDVLKLMADTHILDIILPNQQFDIDKLKNFIGIYPESDSIARLTILTSNPENILWKWSNEQTKRLKSYAAHIEMSESELQNQYLLWQIGKEAFLFHLTEKQLSGMLSAEQADKFKNLPLPVFPVTGGDVAQLGFKGSEISKQLKIAEQLWVELGLSNEKMLVIKSLLDYNKIRNI